MRIAYSRTAAHSYMIVRELDFEAPEYELRMLRYNSIPKLLDLRMIEENGKPEFWYEITGLQSLSSQMELFPMNFLKLRELMENICDLKESLERYFLEEENLWYNPELIFQDRRTRQFYYCYLPGSHASKDGMKTLMEEVLDHLDHSDHRAVKAAYEIYERAASGSLGIRDLMLGILTDQAMEEPLPDRGWEGLDSEWFPSEITDENPSGYQEFTEQNESVRTRKNKRFPMPGFLARHRQNREGLDQEREEEDMYWERVDRIAEDTESAGYGETEFLNITHKTAELRFIYQGGGREQNFSVDHFPFLVGKEPGPADQCLNAPSVSRIHARILQNGSEYFLQDENSTNGTFLNGEILPYRTPIQLQNNDRVIFGTEEYLVTIGKSAADLLWPARPS